MPLVFGNARTRLDLDVGELLLCLFEFDNFAFIEYAQGVGRKLLIAIERFGANATQFFDGARGWHFGDRGSNANGW